MFFRLVFVMLAFIMCLASCGGATAAWKEDQARISKLPPKRSALLYDYDLKAFRVERPAVDPNTTDTFGNVWSDETGSNPNIVVINVFTQAYDTSPGVRLADYLAQKGYQLATEAEMRIMLRDFAPNDRRGNDSKYFRSIMVFNTDGTCFEISPSQYMQSVAEEIVKGEFAVDEQYRWEVYKLPRDRCNFGRESLVGILGHKNVLAVKKR